MSDSFSTPFWDQERELARDLSSGSDEGGVGGCGLGSGRRRSDCSFSSGAGRGLMRGAIGPEIGASSKEEGMSERRMLETKLTDEERLNRGRGE